MTNDRNHISKEELQQYLNGELTGSKAHDFEKKILDRYFESEALEGLEQLTAQEVESDLNSLDEKLGQRINKVSPEARSYTFLWRVAAAVLILASISYLVLNPGIFIQEDPLLSSNEIENASTVDTVATTSKIDLDSSFLAFETEETAELEKDKELEEPIVSPPVESLIAQNSTADEFEEEIVIDDDFEKLVFEDSLIQKTEDSEVARALARVEESNETIQTEVLDEVSASKTSELRSAGAELSRKSIAAVPSVTPQLNEINEAERTTIRGQVFGAEETDPLPGVNISIKGSDHTTISDMNGNFNIDIQTDDILSFNYNGFNIKEIQPVSSNNLKVTMQEDFNSSNEVVITSYSITSANGVIKAEALPLGGYSAYQNYITENLQYPEQANETKVTGRVVVLFTINPGGVLSDFRIKKSLGFGCDEEAIRLIKEGPIWESILRGDDVVKQEIRVTIPFKP